MMFLARDPRAAFANSSIPEQSANVPLRNGSIQMYYIYGA